MKKYLYLDEGYYPLIDDNKIYHGDTSIIYKDNDDLYKIYTKNEPNRRNKLDYLIDKYELLKDISAPPINKIKTKTNIGISMKYLDGTDFLVYIRSGYDIDNFINIIKELSDRLKIINNLNIHFSDLHHHNIIIKDNIPYYLDLDDAVIDKYPGYHISYISRNLHELDTKSYEYEGDLINYGNLDRESIGIFLLNEIFNIYTEKLKYDDFQYLLEDLSSYIDNDLYSAFSRLKNKENKLITIYEVYIGDLLNTNNINGIKKYIKRRKEYESDNI